MIKTLQGLVKNSDISSEFKYEVSSVQGGTKILSCFHCGTCTSDCPIARFSESYRPRQIVRMTQLGLKTQILSSDTLWLCASCFTCSDRCPQNVEVANVIRVLRNLAAQKGYTPQVFREIYTNILETGYSYIISELRIKKRAALGLPTLPKCNVESLRRTLGSVQFPKTVEEGEMNSE